MNNLNEMTKVINKIVDISNKNIKKALPLMKELENIDSDMVEEFMESVDEIGKQMALELLQDTVLGLVRDSETVIKEINNFSGSVIQGEEALEEGEEEYPFLMQVWCGDIYGKEKVDGLRELCQDLKEQQSKLNEESIIEYAIKQLKSNEY